MSSRRFCRPTGTRTCASSASTTDRAAATSMSTSSPRLTASDHGVRSFTSGSADANPVMGHDDERAGQLVQVVVVEHCSKSLKDDVGC